MSEPWTDITNSAGGAPDGYLAMRGTGTVACARITYYPGLPLPHVERWMDKPGCDPDTPEFNYFNAFAPIRGSETDAEWLALLASGVTTMMHPAPAGADTEENTTP